MEIPFTNLRAQFDAIREEISSAIEASINSFQYIRGSSVTQFEEAFAHLSGFNHCIATGNCTDSLFIIQKCLGLMPGDEVITPAFSWISSAETISLCHATPVFVDVDPIYYTIDPALVEKAITPKTKGVIVVHLYGQMGYVEELKQICAQHKLWMIEDCAQAHLATCRNQPAGGFGSAGAFSFYPTKNLGAYGDAGCVVTNDDLLAERLRRFSNHGALIKDDHTLIGMNSRMDSIQASILLAKLTHLPTWTEQRRSNARIYNERLLTEPNVILPRERVGTSHNFHIYAIRAKKRNSLMDFLAKHGIQTMIHYPSALPNVAAYHHSGTSHSDFPISNTLEKEILSLPIYPELSLDNIDYICDTIRTFYRSHD